MPHLCDRNVNFQKKKNNFFRDQKCGINHSNDHNRNKT